RWRSRPTSSRASPSSPPGRSATSPSSATISRSRYASTASSSASTWSSGGHTTSSRAATAACARSSWSGATRWPSRLVAAYRLEHQPRRSRDHCAGDELTPPDLADRENSERHQEDRDVDRGGGDNTHNSQWHEGVPCRAEA